MNDDDVEAGRGFGLHLHENTEIIMLVVVGELTHCDNMVKKCIYIESRLRAMYVSGVTCVWYNELKECETMLGMFRNGFTRTHKNMNQTTANSKSRSKSKWKIEDRVGR
jgi:hypothetical protein